METEIQWVGPMPVEHFFRAFMEVPRDVHGGCPGFNKQMFKEVSDVKTENAMYMTWLEIMSLNGPDFLPGYKLVNTSREPVIRGNQLCHVELTCYQEDVDVSDKYASQLNKAEWVIKFEKSASDNPFGDKANFVDYNDPSPAGRKAKEFRGQLAVYAAELFNHQHRTHVFSIFVSNTKARFLYFDRSGAVVTESFDYTEDATPIVHFMWYYSSLTTEQKGIDITIRAANSEQAKLYRDKLMTFHRRVAMLEVNPEALGMLKAKKNEKTKRQSADGLKNNSEEQSSNDDLTDADWDVLWHDMEIIIQGSMSQDDLDKVARLVQERMPSETRAAVIVKVPCDEIETGYHEVIGQEVSSSAETLVGRSTRAFPVWDPLLDKLLYLKDSWRSATRTETDILKELNSAGVNRVPLLICGGDVQTLKTRTADFSRNYGQVLITPRVHHRFLVDFIGRPVSHFSHTKQMLRAVYNAFNAHREAWEKCRMLHRDISVNNIMLDRWGRGVLNDWDLAKKQPENVVTTGRRHTRTGTWYFMSTLLLQQPGKAHTVQDDIESFVLLVFFLALSYTHHNVDNLTDFMKDFFEESKIRGGDHIGGGEKLSFFILPDKRTRFKVTSSAPLHFWLQDAFKHVSEWVQYCSGFPKDPSVLGLYSHNPLSKLFEDALKLTTWPKAGDKCYQKYVLKVYKTKSPSTGVGGNKRSFEQALDDPILASKKQKLVTSSNSQLKSWPESVEEADEH